MFCSRKKMHCLDLLWSAHNRRNVRCALLACLSSTRQKLELDSYSPTPRPRRNFDSEGEGVGVLLIIYCLFLFLNPLIPGVLKPPQPRFSAVFTLKFLISVFHFLLFFGIFPIYMALLGTPRLFIHRKKICLHGCFNNNLT